MSQVLFNILYAVILVAVIAVSAIISIVDLKKREISNWSNLAILLIGVANLFLQMIGVGDKPQWNLAVLWTGLIAFGGFLLIGVVMFTLNNDAFGGGDVKLVAASGLLLTKMQDILIYAIALLAFSLVVFVIAKIKKQKSVAGGPALCAALIAALCVSAPALYIGIPALVVGLGAIIVPFFILNSKGLLYKGEE